MRHFLFCLESCDGGVDSFSYSIFYTRVFVKGFDTANFTNAAIAANGAEITNEYMRMI